MLIDRREETVIDVIQALEPLAQPYLLQTRPEQLEFDIFRGTGVTDVTAVVSPHARKLLSHS